MTLVLVLVAAAVCFDPRIAIQKPTPPPPAASELEYETYCKKTQQEKRALFRAATPAQKAAIGRTQIERFRDANRARLSKDQLTLLADFLAAVTPRLFDGDNAAAATLAALETRLDQTFSSEDQDAMDRDGPCFPKIVKD